MRTDKDELQGDVITVADMYIVESISVENTQKLQELVSTVTFLCSGLA